MKAARSIAARGGRMMRWKISCIVARCDVEGESGSSAGQRLLRARRWLSLSVCSAGAVSLA